MKELSILINGQHEFSYTLEINGKEEIHTLYYSNNELVWTDLAKGKQACQLIDHGNGWKFTQKKKGLLGYDEMEYLRILLDIIDPNNRIEIFSRKELNNGANFGTENNF